MTTQHKQNKLDILIIGYCNRFIVYIPNDIINLIKIYYSVFFNLNRFLLFPNKLYHIVSGKTYSNIIRNGNIHHHLYKFSLHPQCIANNTSLPEFIDNKYMKNCLNQHTNNLSTDWTINWSLVFQIDHDQRDICQRPCYLTAFHSNFLSSNNCIAFNFELPSFPINPSDFPFSFNSSLIPSIIYSKKSKILYADCTDQQRYGHSRIYSLNCNIRDSEWKHSDSYLLLHRDNSSLCMVDNDQFIAIIGGCDMDRRSLYDLELYAINCDKSIHLKDMKKAISDPLSIYHNKYHRIIVSGKSIKSHGINWYDINKNEWIIIRELMPFNIVTDICLDDDNPNILFIIGCNQMYQIDLRSNNDKSVLFYDSTDNYQNVRFLQL